MPLPDPNKKVDPGWNDPPTLSYTASNPPPKSRITNKRIAFPLSSNKPSPAIAASAPPSMEVNKQEDNLESFDSEIALKQILTNLEKCINKLNSPSSVVSDKINILKTMWVKDQFSKRIQKLILDLSEYIVEDDLEKANECQLQLIMEAAVYCEPWITVFRQLILNEQSKK